MFLKGLKFFNLWRGQQEGAAAIEFSLIALPFIFFTVGIIELSLFFAAGSMLEGSVQTASRMIRTGEIQQSGDDDPEALFREALCSRVDTLVKCDGIQYDVRTLDNFANYDEEEDLESDEDGVAEDAIFSAGGVSDVVMIRVTYLYKFMTPMIGEIFADHSDSRRMLRSTVVFQTEPYEIEEDPD